LGDLLERQAARSGFWRLGTDLSIEIGDRLLEIGIVRCKGQRRFVLRQRVLEVSATMMDLGHAADGREVFRRALEHDLQFGLRLVELIELDERAPERDARGEVPGVNGEARARDRDALFERARAAAFLGELGERDRRRVLLDPASKVFDPGGIGNGYDTVTDAEKMPVRPRLSVTVRVTVNVPAAGNECDTVGEPDGPANAPSPNDHW
jgi:hypothetical protein